MPVIRGQRQQAPLPADKRAVMVEALRNEIAGRGSERGPLIFEIPLDRTSKIDVLVVWDDWADVRSEDRSDAILEAYGEGKDGVTLALGVTSQEADTQNLLPYSVTPVVSPRDVDMGAVYAAARAQGGVEQRGGKVELRLPTLEMARRARAELKKTVPLPDGDWAVSQTVGSVEEWRSQ